MTAPEAPAPVPTSTDTSNFSVEVIEGSLEDDIWGAFDLEDLAEAEGIDESAGQAAAAEDAFATEIIEEPFSFADEVPGKLSAVAPESSTMIPWMMPSACLPRSNSAFFRKSRGPN